MNELDALFRSGVAARAEGRNEEAVRLLSQVVERAPQHAEGWGRLGAALVALNRMEEAIAALRRALALRPNDPDLLCLLGVALEGEGRKQQAAELYRRASAVAPGMGNGFLGLLLAKLGRPVEAQRALTLATEHGPAPFPFVARLAGLRFTAGDRDGAQTPFAAAVAELLTALAADRFDDALEMENVLNRWCVRSVESESHAEACLARWRGEMTAAGVRAARGLPVRKPSGRSRPTVGFFLHQASMLGHVEVALDYAAALAADPSSPVVPRLYVFAGEDPALAAAAQARALPLVAIDAEWDGGPALRPFARLRWLREKLASDAVDALIWVSGYDYVHFGVAFGLAPVNVFWALRFRPVASPHVQLSVACASCFETSDTVNGRPWHVIPLAFADLKGPDRAAEAAAIRRELGGPPLILGTLARAEKMRGAAWLDAVSRVLRDHPAAVFLWAGREKDAEIEAAFAARGVIAQTRFVGWVDTRLYAQVLDIFLDTAPVGCGMTAMEAMAWGKPLVSFKDPLTNWGQCLMPLLSGRIDNATDRAAVERIFRLGSGRELLAWADDADGYADIAARLIADPELRADVAAAGRIFTERYFADTKRPALRLATLIHETLARASV